MKTKQLAVALAAAGLFASSGAVAMPGFSEQAPESSVKICVEQIGERANYGQAGRVLHEVDSKERRVSGHTIKIETTVFAENGTDVIREYATVCAVSDDSVTRRFKIKEKSL